MSIVSGKLISKVSTLAIAMLMSTACVFAADINLSEIEFSPSNDGYNIVLKTDKKVDFRKTVVSDERITIELKNTAATEDFSTIYNEVSDINNITVTPSGKDNLKIQIQGENVANSLVTVDYKDATTTIAQNFDPNQIDLSLPIENYKPVYENDLVDVVEEPSVLSTTLAKFNSDKLIKKINRILQSEQPFQDSDVKWMTYLGLTIIMITACRNIFKPNKEAQIGLSQSLKDREKEIAQKLNAEVKEKLSLRNKVAQNVSAPSINYGLRSYQNSQQNPYENVTAPIRPVRKQVASQRVTSRANAPTSMSVRTERANTVVEPISYQTRSSVNVDSMKFLESMTKIYEKSGRKDLAMGLKNNINKVNI